MHAREAIEAMTRIDAALLRCGAWRPGGVTQHDRQAVMDALLELRAIEPIIEDMMRREAEGNPCEPKG